MKPIERKDEGGMTLIVKTVTRLTVGLILLFGLYILVHGHHGPGGGFSGGVILALSFIHLMLAFGRKTAAEKFSDRTAGTLLGLGALLFVAIALFGYAGRGFFLNFLPKGDRFAVLSGGIIPLCEAAIYLAVGGGLYTVFSALVSSAQDAEEEP